MQHYSLPQLEESLLGFFGYSQFRTDQAPLVERVANGFNAMGILPTSGGKSICFQLPALLKERGIAIVITPLISLMHDQVRELKEKGLPAEYVSSTLDFETQQRILNQASSGQLRLLYVSPELFTNPSFVGRFDQANPINMVIFDEAHCLSQWGHDFRPQYLNAIKMLQKIKSVYAQRGYPPVQSVAVTASATYDVAANICELLDIEPVNVVRGSLLRGNISVNIQQVTNASKRDDALIKLANKHRGEPTLIYANSRKKVEELASLLKLVGLNAAPYHANIPKDIRSQRQHDFLTNQVDILCATTAFGMGVNKPDIRVVINYEAPRTIEDYYQMFGRAGRDGNLAHAYLLCAPNQEREKLQKMLEYSFPSGFEVQKFYNFLLQIQEAHPDEPVSFSQSMLSKATRLNSPQVDWATQFLTRFGILVPMEPSGYFVKALESANFSAIDAMREHKKKKSQLMIAFTEEKKCRQLSILSYFGEHNAMACGICDNCRVEAQGALRSDFGDQIYHEKSSKQALRSQLVQLRTKVSRQFNIPPFLVLSEKALNDAVDNPPNSDVELYEALKLNDVKFERYGAEFKSVFIQHGIRAGSEKWSIAATELEQALEASHAAERGG